MNSAGVQHDQIAYLNDGVEDMDLDVCEEQDQTNEAVNTSDGQGTIQHSDVVHDTQEEQLGRGRRDKRPSTRFHDYVTHTIKDFLSQYNC
ncbi:uncharacterized protein G2W53_028888 [Senna tora]|uniref:Uncharacterized protein n=1 Tax=Senna tora TaxID=362788 RepID=A0A834TD18_9FABA|nr:uncharacterized protein G2W53_028888 [Senna tora]